MAKKTDKNKEDSIQIPLPLMKYKIEKEIISQRVKDGYINATALCKAKGKLFNDFTRLKTTPKFLSALSRSTGIPVDVLVRTKTEGLNELRGSWVHPQVAIHLAQWLSPEFAVQVTQWVFDWMSSKVSTDNLPYHLKRYLKNKTNIPKGHFSILNEATLALIAPLEQMGYILPDNMLPDISMGKLFSKWLRDNGHDPDSMPKYKHFYDDGRVVSARAYPNDIWPAFQKYLIQDWMHNRAVEYFEPRDPHAIPHLKALLKLPNYNDIAGYLDTD